MIKFLLKNKIEATKKIFIIDFFFSIETFFEFSIKFLNIICLDQC